MSDEPKDPKDKPVTLDTTLKVTKADGKESVFQFNDRRGEDAKNDKEKDDEDDS